MEDGDARTVAAHASERDRDTVCGEREERQIRLLRPQAVTGLAARSRLGAVHERRVNLPVECEPQRIGSDFGAQPPPVLVDAIDVVAAHAAEVQRGERALR